MVAGEFADVRCGRLSEAMQAHGWQHDLITAKAPPQFGHVYRNIDYNPHRTYKGFVDAIAAHPASIIQVHCELYGMWVVGAALEGAHGRPVVANVHDLPSARPGGAFDIYEKSAIESADALVFVTEEMRDFAKRGGISVDKPSVVVSNYPSASIFIDGTPLPHIGGVVYEGGAEKRGQVAGWRDMSPIADALDGNLHIYPGNPGCDYGILHETELHYPLLIQRLAQHDWGFVGVWPANEAWTQTVPTKAFEYIAAGIPILAMNCPLLKPLCMAGMGRYVNSLEELVKWAKRDPAPYREAVLRLRDNYSLDKFIAPLVSLYEGLLDGDVSPSGGHHV
jgi:hypothetical protein